MCQWFFKAERNPKHLQSSELGAQRAGQYYTLRILDRLGTLLCTACTLGTLGTTYTLCTAGTLGAAGTLGTFGTCSRLLVYTVNSALVSDHS